MHTKTPFSRKLLLTAVLAASIGGLAAPAFAQATDPAPAAADANAGGPVVTGARTFVDTMAKKTVAFLADKSLSETQKRSQFRTLLFADFDMDTIGRFSLGSYWNQASPQQRQDYLKLFREMIAVVYSQRFENYNGQQFQIRGTRADGNDTLVNSVIMPANSPEVEVDWRVRFKNGQYKIIDVIVEGVSMAVTQRSDFSSVIQQGGGNIQVLLDHLRAPTPSDAPIPTKGQ